MRKIGVLLLGLVLVAGAASMFGYRWVHQSSRMAAARYESAPAPGAGDSRRNVLTEQRGGRPTQAPRGRDGGSGKLDWMSVDVVLNALNVLVGVIGIWLAWLGLRMQQTMAAFQADRRRDAG